MISFIEIFALRVSMFIVPIWHLYSLRLDDAARWWPWTNYVLYYNLLFSLQNIYQVRFYLQWSILIFLAMSNAVPFGLTPHPHILLCASLPDSLLSPSVGLFLSAVILLKPPHYLWLVLYQLCDQSCPILDQACPLPDLVCLSQSFQTNLEQWKSKHSVSLEWRTAFVVCISVYLYIYIEL